MRYFVRIGDAEHEVVLDADGVTAGGERVEARLVDVDDSPVRVVTIGDAVHRVVVRRGAARGAYTLWIDGYRVDAEALDERTRAIRELAGARGAAAGPAPLVAPMPGMIVRVEVAEGDRVQAGQGLVMMEAMKMENELRSPAAGTVRRIHVAPGTAVEKGALLVELT